MSLKYRGTSKLSIKEQFERCEMVRRLLDEELQNEKLATTTANEQKAQTGDREDAESTAAKKEHLIEDSGQNTSKSTETEAGAEVNKTEKQAEPEPEPEPA